MARKPKSVVDPRPLSELQAALGPALSPGDRELSRRMTALNDAARATIAAQDWPALLGLRAWAWQHPLFMTPQAHLRGFLRRWEEALLSGAPLAVAASLVRDDVATAVWDPWERLAARASWAELRPLLRDDAAAWSVAEARVLRGETLGGRSPISGMPLRLFRWEPRLEPTSYSPLGSSWASRGFTGALQPTVLPPAIACEPGEPEWSHLLALWGSAGPRVVRVAGTGLQALACLLGAGEAPDVGACTWKEALAAMLRAHGHSAPYIDGRGMVEARRAVWRLLAALAGARWPVSGSGLQAAMKGWRWLRYDPKEDYADPTHWSLFLALEDPRRGLAWATHAWVTD